MVTDFEKRYIEARRALVSSDYAKLNDKQREAVLATEGPLLILAADGQRIPLSGNIVMFLIFAA